MKKNLSIVLSVIMSLVIFFAMAIPTWAASDKTAGSNTATVIGCGFHCTADGDNGKTYIVGQPKDFGKDATVVLSRDANDPTVWHLVSINGNTGPFVCTACGSSDWYTFSNKSGVPDGKNIQLSDVKKAVVPPVKDPVSFDLEVYHIVGHPGDAPDPGKVLYYDGNSQNTYIPGKGEYFYSKVVDGARGLFDVNGNNVEWLNNTAPEVYTILTLYGAAARENLPADQAYLKMPYACTAITNERGDYTLTTDMNGNLSTATITPISDGHYVLVFWYEPYVFVPYFYYGTIVWDSSRIAQDNPALLQLHGEHAAALDAAGYQIRAGIEIQNPGGCLDAQTSGYVLQSIYDANVTEYGAFWAEWGAKYQEVYLDNCY